MLTQHDIKKGNEYRIGKNIKMRRQQWKREEVHSKSHIPYPTIHLLTIFTMVHKKKDIGAMK